ncbi:MAG: hypothetical protein WC319_13160 [Candidatus Paceibacterota bacterium]|jgi:hypothetical protein
MKKNDLINTTNDDWYSTGLLGNIPDDRKEITIRWFNYATNVMKEISSNDEPYETLIYSIITRIVKEIHVSSDDIKEIINEVKSKYGSIDYSSSYNNIDAEAEFTANYSENKINEFKVRTADSMNGSSTCN